MKRSLTAVAVVAACALTGCSEITGDDENDRPPICRVVGNGVAVTTSSNPSGEFANPTLAFDGHLESYAELSPAQSATGTISGGGLARPGGEYAGIAFTRPASGAITVNITTYKDGVPRETRQAGSTNYTPTGSQSTCPGWCLERDGLVFMGVDTLLEFDTIEAQINMSALPQPLQIRELCVN
jgi:hypothetical protein